MRFAARRLGVGSTADGAVVVAGPDREGLDRPGAAHGHRPGVESRTMRRGAAVGRVVDGIGLGGGDGHARAPCHGPGGRAEGGRGLGDVRRWDDGERHGAAPGTPPLGVVAADPPREGDVRRHVLSEPIRQGDEAGLRAPHAVAGNQEIVGGGASKRAPPEGRSSARARGRFGRGGSDHELDPLAPGADVPCVAGAHPEGEGDVRRQRLGDATRGPAPAVEGA